jgi:hypothetical protein
MKLYTIKDIENETQKNRSTIRDWFFKKRIEPFRIKKGLGNQVTFFYTEEVYKSALLHFNSINFKSRYERILYGKMSKDIICDADLNLIIPSRLNYVSKL